jgi:hypothetical protein
MSKRHVYIRSRVTQTDRQVTCRKKGTKVCVHVFTSTRRTQQHVEHIHTEDIYIYISRHKIRSYTKHIYIEHVYTENMCKATWLKTD